MPPQLETLNLKPVTFRHDRRPKTPSKPHSSEQLPASTRVYVQGQIHPDVQVPMREITLSPTKAFNGRIEQNEPVRVYDCSGPWGDPNYTAPSKTGLPALRKAWILARNDVEAYEGRAIEPRDNGYLTANHAEYAAAKREGLLSPLKAPINAQRQPLKAKPGKVVTQLGTRRLASSLPRWSSSPSAKTCIARRSPTSANDIVRNDLDKQHVGSGNLKPETPNLHSRIFRRFPQRIPNEITPSSSAPKSPPAAPSSRTTSITPSSSR
jgi:phosphomethylpyrimidine synthase